MNEAEKIYRELAINPIAVSEAIGDNKIDNMMQELNRTTEVELGMFTATMLQKSVKLFVFDYETPKYDAFDKAFSNLKERYQVMNAEEQADLFAKIEQMFKEIFVEKYSGLGPQAAEDAGTIYAQQMIEVLKSSTNQVYPEKTIY